MPETLPAEQLYRKFESVIKGQRRGSWVLGVFEGSPRSGAYSWCSDCVAASNAVASFFAEYKGEVKLIQFKVGTREEWEGKEHRANPFRANSPFLSDLPTAVLFYGRLDVARVIAPRKDDLLHLCRRASIYEKQIENGSWHPPRGTGAQGPTERP
jgi:uncharacterized protein DUF953